MIDAEPRIENRPLVYIIEQQPFNYSAAEVYGQLMFLSAKKLAPYSLSPLWNNEVLRSLRHELADYVPEYDFIVPTGAPNRILLVGMLLKERGSKHKILGWDAKQQRYIEYLISI